MDIDLTVQQPVLVTGATGFLGGQLVRRLLERHCRVSCLVRPDSRINEAMLAGSQRIIGDVLDRRSVERALAESQATTVFHLAGLVRARRKNDFMRVNESGVDNVAAACADRPNPPILVAVSSLAAAGPDAADRLRVEDDMPSPISNYGHSKLAGERAAAKYAGAVPITIVRPPVVFGPWDRGVFQIFRPIARWGLHLMPRCLGFQGRERRISLIHVDDLVEGLLLAAEKGERLREQRPAARPPAGQGIYFIAGDETLSYVQLGRAIAHALGLKPPAVLRLPGTLLRLLGIGGDAFARISGQPTWISSDKIADVLAGSWTCSAAKARTHLGWSPAGSLADRLHATAQWYRQARWL